jgi:FkbM family methyltransferase
MKNIALNRPATQSSTSSWSTSSIKEVDAVVANNGDITSSRWFHTTREFRPWWQVSLEGYFIVKRVVIYNRLDANERLKRFSILRSNDGKNWFECFSKKDDVVFNEYTAELTENCLARFIRIRIDGTESLHFRECQIFGDLATSSEKNDFLELDDIALLHRRALPEGRNGHITEIGGFYVFVDEDKYGESIRRSLDTGRYEGRERQLVSEFLSPRDRAIEIGTAIGVVTMTAASIVGPGNIVTFDANPEIISDAKGNFRRNDFHDIRSNTAILVNNKNFNEGASATFHISRDFWGSRLNIGPNGDDIVKSIAIPVMNLERQISETNSNVLICDIEGGEVDLLVGADLSNIRMIIMETHYWSAGESATDAMLRSLIMQGFSMHLGASGSHVSILRR